MTSRQTRARLGERSSGEPVCLGTDGRSRARASYPPSGPGTWTGSRPLCREPELCLFYPSDITVCFRLCPLCQCTDFVLTTSKASRHASGGCEDLRWTPGTFYRQNNRVQAALYSLLGRKDVNPKLPLGIGHEVRDRGTSHILRSGHNGTLAPGKPTKLQRKQYLLSSHTRTPQTHLHRNTRYTCTYMCSD